MSQGDEESFFDLLSRFQSKRMDDQRCSLTVAENKENANCVPNSKHMLPLNNSNGRNCITLQVTYILTLKGIPHDIHL
jgi:G-protein signaling modulator 2